MREILFRGKRTDNGEWAYGAYYGLCRITNKDGGFGYEHLMRQSNNEPLYMVAPETVGEYTGLKDKNGKRIFEGDIVANAYGRKGLVEFFTEDIGSCGCCVPQFDGSGFKAKYKNDDSGVDMRHCTIIGNIYDNPEMWEVKE